MWLTRKDLFLSSAGVDFLSTFLNAQYKRIENEIMIQIYKIK